MELYVLDVEGTKEDISLNGGTKEMIQAALDNLENMLNDIDLDLEITVKKVGDSYITSFDNKIWLQELYGFKFSKVVITNL
ncbi:hypothetical protein [Clostridium sp.]|uniref:hypothetical protein n=1 Tax=Clostridium sp. TaxID=1506 RepID=UPI001A51B25B|nr:hypothetical protein [Clostridium sp.]MBK5242144.1 hypothetical protein [Clostridium sp.]